MLGWRCFVGMGSIVLPVTLSLDDILALPLVAARECIHFILALTHFSHLPRERLHCFKDSNNHSVPSRGLHAWC